MNKTAIKNFAISARKKLIAMAKDRAGIIGITAEQIMEPTQRGSGYAIYPTHFGTQTTLTGAEINQRASLVRQIREKGYESVMEEVAYTWFNRLIAVRFMEVNDYLPTRVRVLSSETKGKQEPDLVTEAPKVDLGFTDAEVENIYALKDDPRKSGELFKKLFIKQCNELGKILPGLFEETADYTEFLLDIAWDKGDGVVRELLNIDEADFHEAVEIIGWMYQYYNTEPKAAVFGRPSGVKIKKEEIPAATQLFTPDWIVRYMVENSLGRLWLTYCPTSMACGNGEDALRELWNYYLEEAEQEPEVEKKLKELTQQHFDDPTQIKFIDPCMGSGHILVYAFDVLMQIYVSCGYSERDAALNILENNLYGLDIDERAYQLSYFAVMMKTRQYNRRLFSLTLKDADGAELPYRIEPHFYAIHESNEINRNHLNFMGDNIKDKSLWQRDHDELCYVLDFFNDAKEYGSLLAPERDLDYKRLYGFCGNYQSSEIDIETLGMEDTSDELSRLIEQYAALRQKYDVVVTNPPYMAVSNGNAKLNEFVKKNYPDSKSDLFACFIERCQRMTKPNGYTAMITQHSWMFLSSFEKLREKLLHTDTVNMAHFGARAFEEIGGEVVQTTSWVQRNAHVPYYKGTYARLVNYGSQQEKENAFLAHRDLHTAQQENFSKIPGSPIAYWVSEKFIDAFEQYELLGSREEVCGGLTTGDNNRFLHLWFEVVMPEISFDNASIEETKGGSHTWYPMAKGGNYRKWYGNMEYVVNWKNDGEEIKYWVTHNSKDPNTTHWSRRLFNIDCYFKNMITWSGISSGKPSMRFAKKAIFGSGAKAILPLNNFEYYLAFLNSTVALKYLCVLSPTLNYESGHIAALPIANNTVEVSDITKNNISLSKTDWDSFETSWDFKRHPLVLYGYQNDYGLVDGNNINKAAPLLWNDELQIFELEKGESKHPQRCELRNCYTAWQKACERRFQQLKTNEEELNRIFIDIYGLQDELTPEEEDKDVTVHRVFNSKDDVPESMKGSSYVRTLHDEIISLVFYAVGCMFGRYSLDVEGLVYAGGDWNQKYIKTGGLFPSNTLYPSNNLYPSEPKITHIRVDGKDIPLTYVPDTDNILPITDDAYFPDDIVTRFCDFVKTVYGADTLEENLGFVADALGNKGSSTREVIRNYFLKDFYKDHCKTYQKRPIYWLFDSGKQDGFKALIYLHRYDPDTVGRVRADYLHKQQGFLESAIANCDYILQADGNPHDKAAATKKKDKLVKQLAETRIYDQALAHIAFQRIPLDLDDGVKVNYEKFQNIEVAREGQKALKIDLLAKI